MTAATYPIAAGDYERGGDASKQLKGLLKQIGADPAAIRRTMIAAYEAEMNVVIHANGGEMRVAVEPDQVEVAVLDEGPGIPNIDRAMNEGYSTAPSRARELGFGAGMGLPNIRKNSDRFTIHSQPGQGTQLRFLIRLQPVTLGPVEPNAVAMDVEKCTHCLRCVVACPTGAVRTFHDTPSILEHRCVDCTACAAACPSSVFDFKAPPALPNAGEETVLVLPSSFCAQFGARVGLAQVFAALGTLGFHHVLISAAWEDALRDAARALAAGDTVPGPVIAPVCPAVMNLIRMRYPSLLPHVAPYLAPLEAAREQVTAAHAVFVAPCPAEASVLGSAGGLTRVDVVHPSALTQALLPLLHRSPHAAPPVAAEDCPPPGIARDIHVSGMDAVLHFLERVEDGFAWDAGVVELYACEEGCFGAPVWREHPSLARWRFEHEWAEWRAHAGKGIMERPAAAIRRLAALKPRAGLRLDDDMRRAMAKLGEIERLTRELPGRDCAVCGAPTCAALAEDAVRGTADLKWCPYREGTARVEPGGAEK